MKSEQTNGSSSETFVSFQNPDEPDDDQPLSLEEQRSLAGASPLALPEERLDVELPSRGWANSAVPRTFFVAGLVGTVCLFAFAMTMMFSGRQKVVEAPVRDSETDPVTPDRSDQLKTQLALVGQGQDQVNSPVPKVRTPPPVRSRTTVQPTVRPAPPQPQIQTRTITTRSAPSAPIAPATPPEPDVDPFEQWNDLASAGAMRGDVDMESFRESAQQPATPIAEVRIASAMLGVGSLPNMAGDRPSPIAAPERMESAIELSPGANGILNRCPTIAGGSTGEVPLGSVADAEVMIPLIWAGGGNTRSAVQLKDALNDEAGNEVLPSGTIFITQVTNVDEGSRLIEQTAVSVLYEKNGKRVEENIPPGLILILDRDLEPLKADRIRSRRGFDVARGLGQAIASAENELPRSAASNLLGELADQVRRRSNRDGRINNQTALTIKAGKNVSVMVNGFLGVNP
jgi:hypothetical protein